MAKTWNRPRGKAILLVLGVSLFLLTSFYLNHYLPFKQQMLHLAWKGTILDGSIESIRVLGTDVPVGGGTFMRQVTLAVNGMALWALVSWLAFFHFDPGLMLLLWGTWRFSFPVGLGLLVLWALVSMRLERFAQKDGLLHHLHILSFRYVPLFLVLPWALARLMIQKRTPDRAPFDDPVVRDVIDLSMYHVPVIVFYSLAILMLVFGIMGGARSVVAATGDLHGMLDLPEAQRYYLTGFVIEAQTNGFELIPDPADLREIAVLHLAPILTKEHLPAEYVSLMGLIGLEAQQFDHARYAELVTDNALFFTLVGPLLTPLVAQIISTLLYFAFIWLVLPRRTDTSVFSSTARALFTIIIAWLVLSSVDLGLRTLVGDIGVTTAPTNLLAIITLMARWVVVLGGMLMAYVVLRFDLARTIVNVMARVSGNKDGARAAMLVSVTIALIAGLLVAFIVLAPVLDRLVLSPMNNQVQSHPELYYDTLIRAGLSINRYLADIPVDSVQVSDLGGAALRQNFRFKEDFLTTNADMLSTVRLWDRERARVRTDRNMGEVPYLDIGNEDFLVREEDGRMAPFWAVELPLRRDKVTDGDFYNNHQFYTHSDQGFMTLDAHTGHGIENAYPEDQMYYGVHEDFSLLESYLTEEGVTEVGGVTYEGKGLDVPVPDIFFYDAHYIGLFPNALRRWRVPSDETFYWRWAEAIDRGDISSFKLLLLRRLDLRLRNMLPMLATTEPFDIKGNDPYPITYRGSTWFLMHGFIALDLALIPLTRMEVTGGVGSRDPVEAYARYAVIALGNIYTGEIELYAPFDDQLSQLLRSVYPDLSRELPDEVRRQLRYPKQYFTWRAHKHFDFHPMPEDYYKGLDFFKSDPSQQTMYYTPFQMDDGATEFVGILPALLDKGEAQTQTETGLVGLYVVRNSFLRDDLAHFGDIVLYRFPKSGGDEGGWLFYSYQAIERNYKGDARYQEWARLKESETLKPGNMLLYRIGRHWIYIRPIYLETGKGITRLEKVVAMLGSYQANATRDEYRVGFGDDLSSALRDLMSTTVVPPTTEPSPDVTIPPPSHPGTTDDEVVEALSTLKSLVDEKVECLRANDLACAISVEARMTEAEARLAELFARQRTGGGPDAA